MAFRAFCVLHAGSTAHAALNTFAGAEYSAMVSTKIMTKSYWRMMYVSGPTISSDTLYLRCEQNEGEEENQVATYCIKFICI